MHSSVPFNVPASSDDFCNHPQDVCSGAGVASAGMPCAGVVNIVSVDSESSKNVDGVAGTVKPDCVVHVARYESDRHNDDVVCSGEVEVDLKVTEPREEIR